MTPIFSDGLLAVAMVFVGLLLAAFALFSPPMTLPHAWPSHALVLVAGGAVVALIGLWLLWEDFIAPLFVRR